ncbi:MAG: potassium channel protein [Anaerolineales bacterium]|nr:potassium channel protein [Anaerolineales bacterium]
MVDQFRGRILRISALFIAISALGTIGYMLIEGWSFIDALYMTAITLTTVGFGEVYELSRGGRVFTLLLMIMGVSSVAYGFGVIGEYLLTTNLTGLARKRRMNRTIEQIKEHYIVCGYGRVGRNAAEVIREGHKGVVIIDYDEKNVQEFIEHDWLYIFGDATNDEVLLQAGVERAKGLLVCTGDDANNLFIVLSARALNSNLTIVSRSTNPNNESKIIRAGANKVISPYRIGGQRMANIIIRPSVTDFFDVVTLDSGLELWLEDITIQPSSPLVGKTLTESNVRQQTGVTVIILNRKGQRIITPGGNTLIEPKDEILALGTREQLAELEKLATGGVE